jgi:hypothetical protein
MSTSRRTTRSCREVLLRFAAAALALMCALPAGAHEGLRCTLQAPARAAPGQPVLLRFTFRNEGRAPLHLLTWNTPFEGWFGAYVSVSRDGVPLPYGGPMAKRGDPARDDYLRIAPGRSRSAEVDLALPFDLSRPGRYRIEPRLHLHDLVPGSRPRLPRPRGQWMPADLGCNAVDVDIGAG